jgi:hypothetical protein
MVRQCKEGEKKGVSAGGVVHPLQILAVGKAIPQHEHACVESRRRTNTPNAANAKTKKSKKKSDAAFIPVYPSHPSNPSKENE